MAIHDDDILKALSRDERYGQYDYHSEILESAIHYLARFAKEIGLDGMFRVVTFEFLVEARVRILTMLIEDYESPLGVLERQRDKLLVAVEMAKGDAGLQQILFAMEFTLTPEAAEWFAAGVLTVEELFRQSPGTMLPN